jgi:WD repeat-containing protein 26
MIRGPTGKDQGRLALVHTYIPAVPVDFAGPSYFGGKDDQFILCAGKGARPHSHLSTCSFFLGYLGGEVNIWDRETGIVLHSMRAHWDQGADLTGIAWNHAAGSLMFASAAHDGSVRIWTAPPPVFPIPQLTYTEDRLGHGRMNSVDTLDGTDDGD